MGPAAEEPGISSPPPVFLADVETTLRYFEGCPNWETARDRLQAAIGRAGLEGRAEITLELVPTEEEAERLRFRGSPTILIDGADPFAEEDGPFGLSCRIYQTDQGMEGSPSVAQLRQALAGER